MRRLSSWLLVLVLTATAATACRAAEPDLKTVLARHAQAMGGLEKIRALKAMRAEGTISAGGISGKVRSYVAYPDRMRSEIEIAFVRQTVVQDSRSVWTMDQSGQVKDMSGLELQNMLAEGYVETFGYLLAPGEGSVAFSREMPESTQYITLEVRPAGGTPVQLCLDPATFLVRKKVSPSAVGKVEVYLSDYREVGGVKMAFHTLQMLGGDAMRAITAQTVSAEAVASLPDTLWRKPGASARDWTLPEGVRSVSVPAEVYNHHVFLKVRVNASEPLNFLLDSGAGATVIEKARAAALGLKSEGKLGAQGVGGTADYSFSKVDSLAVGGVLLSRQNVITMGLPDILAVLGRPLDGILGYDFLSRFVVTVDYAQRLVTITDPDAWKAPAGARAVDIELLHNVPVVRAACDGKYSGRFVVDTGNSGTLMLHGPFVRENKLLERATRKIEVHNLGAGGEETNYMVRMDSLVLGGLVVPRPLVTLATASTGVTGGSGQLAGNIGAWVLEKFAVTFDYSRGKMYLEPNAQLGEPMSAGRIGWQVAGRNSRLEVRFVAPGTPAEEAGLKEGDVLLKMGDQDITSLDAEAFRHATEKDAGTRLTFEIKRGEERKQITVTLRELL